MENTIIHILMDENKSVELFRMLDIKDFSDAPHRRVFEILERYYKKFCEMPSRDVFTEIVGEDDNVIELMKLYNDILNQGVDTADYDYHIDKFFNIKKKEYYYEKLLRAVSHVERGDFKDEEAFQSSIDEALSGIHIYDEKGRRDINRGNITKESLLFLDEYKKIKYGDEVSVKTPIGWLDDITGGCKRGHFWILGGHKGEGKTTALINFAYSTMMQGQDVLVISMEMRHIDFLKKIYSRHVLAYDDSITFQDLDRGLLTVEQEKNLKEALEDLENNETYGKFHMISAGGLTTEDIRAEVKRYKPYAVYIDYIQLLKPTKGQRAGQRSETLSEIIKDVRAIALNDNVFILSAHQIKRAGFERSRKVGHYTMTDFGESSEVEASATCLISVYMTDVMGESNEVRFGNHKNRYGKTDDLGKIVHFNRAKNFIGDLIGNVEI